MVYNQKRKKLGDILVEAGAITSEQLEHALKAQKQSGKKLGYVLAEEGIIDERAVISVLEMQIGIKSVDVERVFIDVDCVKLINENMARKYEVLPFKRTGNTLTVAMTDPLNFFAVDDLRIATGFEIEPVISIRNDILGAIERYYGRQGAERAVEDFRKQFAAEQVDLLSETDDSLDNAPIVRLVGTIIKQALKSRASDIHIEPLEEAVRVRYRIDGELTEAMTVAKSTYSAIVTRVKIMGKLDIAEKRLPQDGRVEMKIEGREVDLRISSLPSILGEKVVIRLLTKDEELATIRNQGFSDVNMRLFRRVTAASNGIILVTGPTGSGKTTTLYALLSELNRIEKNIVTVEDPIEYKLSGITQVAVNTKTGLTFANSLRSILRQDPDIIMIGEIRDGETAQIAARAAVTGHLVLSTMHTNDTASTVMRLMDMGVERYHISSTVVGVVSQRLVRRVCGDCKTMIPASPEETELLGGFTGEVARGRGCSTCGNTGYKGRIAVHEVMLMSRKVRDLINSGAGMDSMRDAAVSEGMITLAESCAELVKQGITTPEEMLKILFRVD